MTNWGRKLEMGVKVGLVPCGSPCNTMIAVCETGVT